MVKMNVEQTARHFVEVDEVAFPESGTKKYIVSVTRKNPASYQVYVGHPISGIRVGRIMEMQQQIMDCFGRANRGTAQQVHCLFPLRTTHLGADEVGDNEYEAGASLFSDTRHFTLQNRMDALMSADAVLVNFNLRDDDGNYRISKGIPFDYGWASSVGKAVVTAIQGGNPNMCEALTKHSMVFDDLEQAVFQLNAMLPHGPRTKQTRVLAEVFDFSSSECALSMIASLAAADAHKHRDGGRAIIAVIPEGKSSVNWHGQIGQVADWVLPEMEQAEKVVQKLLDN